MDRMRTLDDPRTEAVPTFPSYAEIRTRQLRAEASAQMLSAAARRLSAALRPVLAGLARWRERRRTNDALMRCSDRVLADIGIAREDIPLIARGIDPSRPESGAPAMRSRWAAARARLAAARAARRERRRVYRELMSYRDHELDDLGVRRSDIAGIARGEPVLRRAA
jgi:uncharacterized protein YjiS (DUF1127 family)